MIAGSAIGLVAADSLSSSDQMFAKKAAQGGMAEVQLGQLATTKGSNQKVKDFGQKMVDDHGKANDQLKSIAGKDHINLPTSVSAKDKALMAHLSGMSGDAFDKAYVSAMVKDHKTDIAQFEAEANGGQNGDLKDFASSHPANLKTASDDGARCRKRRWRNDDEIGLVAHKPTAKKPVNSRERAFCIQYDAYLSHFPLEFPCHAVTRLSISP